MSLFCTFCATINIGEWRISLKWLVGINLTSRGLNLTSSKIINFTSCCENSQNFEPKSGFKPIRYLHEPPMKPVTKLFQIHSMNFSCKIHVSSFMCAVIVCHDLEKYEECVTKMFQKIFASTFDFWIVIRRNENFICLMSRCKFAFLVSISDLVKLLEIEFIYYIEFYLLCTVFLHPHTITQCD